MGLGTTKNLTPGIFLALLFSLHSTLCSGQTLPLTIDETLIPMRVDGHLVEWPAARMILLDKKSQVTYGKAYWKGADDFSGRVFLTYDADDLYISVIVTKTTPPVNEGSGLSLWNGDCLELFLSVDPDPKSLQKIGKDDYHIGFSPGTKCKYPRMYCFNKDREIVGGRIAARMTMKGYLLEASIPWDFFKGVQLFQGQKAALNVVLDEGGNVSGNRIVQLDYIGNPESWENPSTWTEIQWVGKAAVTIASGEGEDLNSELVKDGTFQATFLGHRPLKGVVVDSKGKPLSGAKVTTWPRSIEVVTDLQGAFLFPKVKLFDRSLICARKDGYASSLSPLVNKNVPVTVVLGALPAELDTADHQVSRCFYGENILVPEKGGLDQALTQTLDWVKPMGFNILRLIGLDATPEQADKARENIDRFIAYCREVGAEPVVTVPIDRERPESAGDWVKYCNVEKGYKIRFWSVGDEPDKLADRDPLFADYNAYDYINDFRAEYNAMKRVDPSILIMGPDLAWKYAHGEDDWLTPFLQYDGDIVNMISLHRYAALTPALASAIKVKEGLRNETTLLRGLRDKVLGNTDVSIPLLMTGGNVCAQDVTGIQVLEKTKSAPATGASFMAPNDPVTDLVFPASGTAKAVTIKKEDVASPQGIWSALWMAEELGLMAKEDMGMGLFSNLLGSGALDSISNSIPRPAYWALRMFAEHFHGKVIPAQTQFPDLSVFACQDPKTKEVVLMTINTGDRYCHPRISLNGKDTDIVVDAGLDIQTDFEMPYFSVVCLTLKADHSPGEATTYFSKLAMKGKEPMKAVFKP